MDDDFIVDDDECDDVDANAASDDEAAARDANDEASEDDLEIELRDDIDVVREHENAERAREVDECETRKRASEEAGKHVGDDRALECGGVVAAASSRGGAREGTIAPIASRAAGRRTATVYALGNYTFGTKKQRGESDGSIAAKLLRMKTAYEKRGKRVSVGAICMVNQHKTPHVLLLQVTPTSYKLPGGRLRAGEGDEEGLLRKLRNKLQPERDDGLAEYEFEIGDRVATWYRTAFEPNMYPYLPAHITKPKEELKLFVVQMPEKCYFAVPKNLKLLAVPIFELYGNPSKYGPEIASIPHLLSNYRLQLD